MVLFIDNGQNLLLKIKKIIVIFDRTLKKTIFLMQAPLYKQIIPVITVIFAFSSCNPNPEPVLRKIKQSVQVYDDNVNGRIAGGNIAEVNNFFYNSDGLVDHVSVYDDTSSSATLIKEIFFSFFTDKVSAYTIHQIDGYQYYEFHFDANKRITKLVDSMGFGLEFSYNNNKISLIRNVFPGDTLNIQDFVYDLNGNLTSYNFVYRGDAILSVDLEYSNDLITDELDTRFFNKDIRFIYIGGLNLVTKLGLNFGLNNKNTLLKRTEYLEPSGDVKDVYDFGYIYNDNNEIIKRNIRYNTDTLFYQFEY
jgi:hypothetical protein